MSEKQDRTNSSEQWRHPGSCIYMNPASQPNSQPSDRLAVCTDGRRTALPDCASDLIGGIRPFVPDIGSHCTIFWVRKVQAIYWETWVMANMRPAMATSSSFLFNGLSMSGMPSRIVLAWPRLDWQSPVHPFVVVAVPVRSGKRQY